MDTYVFPFSTCEIPQPHGIIAQPYSAMVNFMSVLIILYFLFFSLYSSPRKPKTSFKPFFSSFFSALPLRCVLISLLLFELWHTFSHVHHISNKKLQLNVIHSLAYLINLSYLWFFYHISQRRPGNWTCIFLFILVSLDVYAFFNLSLFFYFLTQIVMFSLIMYEYRSFLPKQYLPWMMCLVVIIIILFVNEMWNCKTLLKRTPFPYHALIETVGLVLIWMICRALVNMHNRHRLHFLSLRPQQKR